MAHIVLRMEDDLMPKSVKASPQARSRAMQKGILGTGKVKVAMTSGQRRAVKQVRTPSRVSAQRPR